MPRFSGSARNSPVCPPDFRPIETWVPANGAVPVFDDVGNSWGLDTLGVSHGMALGDLDGDGDADLVVNF